MDFRKVHGLYKVQVTDDLYRIQAQTDDGLITLATVAIEDVDIVLADYIELWHNAFKESKWTS